MSITSARTVTLLYIGDFTGQINVGAQANPSAVRPEDSVTLASGANTITVPTGGGTQPTAVTIWPPNGNTTSITLKGVTGDTGIALHLTDPTTIALASSQTSFVLTAGTAGITGLRLYWS